MHYIRPKFSGMGKWWSLLVLVCVLATSCNINRDIMFKTATDYQFQAYNDSSSKNLVLQPNDMLQFRLFANDGFRKVATSPTITVAP